MADPSMIIINVLSLYIVVGLLFSIAFLWKGINKVDEATKGTGVGFRLLLLPGLMVFWPLFLIKWLKK